MDLQFSSDDAYLAAGSGDQTAQIVDVRTQQTLSVLAKHKSSVKQVRFQPGDDKIVATSSRDGAVQIWDLRCKGGQMSVHSAWGSDAPYASVIRTLASAHADGSPAMSAPGATSSRTSSMNKVEPVNRRNDVSITALSFLPEGREHLLLTASDASTCVKLWDIRGRYSLRGPAIPISTTRHPESHNRHRHFAINSLTLNGDASRLYALSKDNTVYAYSTSHLILGVAPELCTTSSSKQKYCGVGQEGLGPIYGFRHQNFHAGSFYVKASLRKAHGDKTELLAALCYFQQTRRSSSARQDTTKTRQNCQTSRHETLQDYHYPVLPRTVAAPTLFLSTSRAQPWCVVTMPKSQACHGRRTVAWSVWATTCVFAAGRKAARRAS
jgi:hypothetical protein